MKPTWSTTTWLWLARGLALPCAVALGGCVTLKRPNGEPWTTPVDLRLATNSLDGTVIRFECGVGEYGATEFGASESESCRDVARVIRALGADLLTDFAIDEATAEAEEEDEEADAEEQSSETAGDDESESAHFIVQYIDRGVERDFCGWTLPLFIISATYFPCVEDLTAHAELRILTIDGVIADRRELSLGLRTLGGIPIALYYLATAFNDSLEARDRELAQALVQTVRNAVYAFNLRRQLAAPERPEESAG